LMGTPFGSWPIDRANLNVPSGLDVVWAATLLKMRTESFGIGAAAIALLSACAAQKSQQVSLKGRDTPPPRLLAVLELRSQLAPADARGVPDGYFSDAIRGQIHDRVPSISVMTKENILLLLPEKHGDLADCEADCEVETGRRIGADLIVTGEVLKFGDELTEVWSSGLKSQECPSRTCRLPCPEPWTG
jgi:hypothetical protein